MDAAGKLDPSTELSESLPWASICVRYPNQFVCLVDVVKTEPHSPEIATGRVAGHGPTRRDASEIIRGDLGYSAWTVVYTGRPTRPLRRPPVYVD